MRCCDGQPFIILKPRQRHTKAHTQARESVSNRSPSLPFKSPKKTRVPREKCVAASAAALTCQGLDARALKQSRRAVVVVELLIRQVEARVDVAVLLRDLCVVKVGGGRHGGGRREGSVQERAGKWEGEGGERGGQSLNEEKQTDSSGVNMWTEGKSECFLRSLLRLLHQSAICKNNVQPKFASSYSGKKRQ